MKILSYKCDIDSCNNSDVKHETLQIIFTTHQNDGHGRNPYLDTKTIDICTSCYQRVLQGEAIYAAGAQGHNEYWFKTK